MQADGHHIHLSQDGSLIISNVQETDEGSYTCSAYSSSNSVSSSTEVKVLRSQPSSEYNLATPLLLAHCLPLGCSCRSAHSTCPPTTDLRLWGAAGASGLCYARSPAFPGQKNRTLETHQLPPHPAPSCWKPD